MLRIYRFLLPIGVVVAILLTPFFEKLKVGFLRRRSLLARIRQASRQWGSRPLWFHVASSGEFEQCLPVLDTLHQQFPRIPLLLTYFSPSAEQAVALEVQRRESQNRAVSWAHSDYSPLDLRHQVRAFIRIVQPRALILLHRELWPNWLSVCQEESVPRFLFATYFPSLNVWQRIWYRSVLRNVDFIGTSESGTQLLLNKLFLRIPIEILGDSRIERVMQRKEQSIHFSWEKHFDEFKTLLCASLHQKDLWALALILRQFKGELPDWRLVLVPHNLNRAFIARLESSLSKRGLVSERWSQWITCPKTNCHLVVDTVGILAELYRVSDLVFVGGSFDGRVHNILEPAAYGKSIVTGPFIQNSGEAVTLWKEKKALIRSEDRDELSRAILQLARNDDKRRELAIGVERYIFGMRGAHIRYAKTLSDLLQLSE